MDNMPHDSANTENMPPIRIAIARKIDYEKWFVISLLFDAEPRAYTHSQKLEEKKTLIGN